MESRVFRTALDKSKLQLTVSAGQKNVRLALTANVFSESNAEVGIACPAGFRQARPLRAFSNFRTYFAGSNDAEYGFSPGGIHNCFIPGTAKFGHLGELRLALT